MIIPLDWKNKAHIQAACRLHASLLPDSPVPQLGHVFMSAFYYKVLIKSKLIKCDLYECDGEMVAFSSYTDKPFSFMQEGKQKAWLKLAFVLLLAMITKPSRIGLLIQMAQLGSKRGGAIEQSGVGEILSLGVSPNHISHSDQKAGRNISNVLLERAMDYFKDKKYNHIDAIIRKNNLLSILFFKSYQAKVEPCDYIGSNFYRLRLYLNVDEQM